jgi:AcrR family transcriptional regulator
MAGDHRSNPRRRGADLEAALLDAAAEELREVGFAKMTIESVARRAGASKVSIYSRWRTRSELAAAAAYRLVGRQSAPAGTGTLRGDLLAWLRAAADQLTGPAGEAFRGIVLESLREEDGVRPASLSRGHGALQLRQILQDAAGRGEDVLDDPTARQLQAPQALLQMHFLTHGAPIDDAVLAGIVDEVALPLLRPSSGVASPTTEPRQHGGTP